MKHCKRSGVCTSAYTIFVAFLLALAVAACDSTGAGGGSGDGSPGNDSGGDGDSSTDTTAPAEVSGLTADERDQEIRLTWTDPSDEDFDHVEVTWSPDNGDAQPMEAAAGNESATVTGLSNGTEYTFTVKTVDGDDNASEGKTTTAIPSSETSGTVATDGTVNSYQKISDTEGGFTGTIENSYNFGTSVDAPGDLDGDGIADIAVGVERDSGGGVQRGVVWLLFLNENGTVAGSQKIGDGVGGFAGTLSNHDNFGSSIASPGDIDGDGIGDLVVGAWQDDGGGTSRGAVWVLFMNADGTVASQQEISDTAGGFTGSLDDEDKFGKAVTSVGDMNGDGIPDLAVGSWKDDDGGKDRGAVWILFLSADGTVASSQKISDTAGSFAGTLDDSDRFGTSVASPGDLDGNGTNDLVVGADGDDDGEEWNRGAVWVLFLNADGTVSSSQKISDTEGGFTGTLATYDNFGASVASPGDLDNDGVTDIVVGAVGDNGGGGSSSNRGAVWVLFLNSDGTVKGFQRINDTEGSFAGTLSDDDEFGTSVASVGDLDGDDVVDLVVGADGDDDGGNARGAVWVLFLSKAQ